MVGSIIRSLVFYLVFYSGSVIYVLLCAASLMFGAAALQRMCENWSGYHRLCVTWILGIRVVVEGLVPDEPVLVALKHESFFEAIDLPTLLPHPAIFAKAELMRIPMWGRLGATYGLIPVERDRGASALRAMITAVRRYEAAGRPVAIFPEGTRTPHDTVAPLQAGFAGIYKMLGKPVVPIAVNSGPLYHRRWKRRGTITYLIGETIPAGLPRGEVEQRVTDAINALNRAEPTPSAT